MLKYSNEEVKAIAVEIFNDRNLSVRPVGNHHLKRHLVYEVVLFEGGKYILKLYYIKRRRSRELASLRELENSGVKCPVIYKQGNLEDGSEWLVTKYIKGELLDKVFGEMTGEEKLNIFKELGEEMGRLHSYKSFPFFGEWDEEGRPVAEAASYYRYFRESIEEVIERVLSQELPDKEILVKAIKEVRNSYDLINIDIIPRLIHNDFDGRNILVERDSGGFRLSGIIDFEGCYPGNCEEDLVGLYYRYFIDNGEWEEAFFKSYERFLSLDSGFKDRLRFYMLCFSIENCSWAYKQADDYYVDNINFLRKML